LQDNFEDKILRLCYEMKPSYMLTIGNDDENFIDGLFKTCQDNRIFLNVVSPSEKINIDNFKEKYNFDLINIKSFNKFLMLNKNNVILINGNFYFNNLYNELMYILNEYSPKEFPFIIFYNTLNNTKYENNFQKLKVQYNNKFSKNLKDFILKTNMDLFFYSTFLFNGLHILCSNSERNRKLIYDNFIKFLSFNFEDNLNKFVCFETKNIKHPFSYETLFINTQNFYGDDFSKENIADIIQREVVLTESKKELHDVLVQKENEINSLHQDIENIIQREVVLTESKKELHEVLIQKDKLIAELKSTINKLYNNIVQRDMIINNLNDELENLNSNKEILSKNNNELQNMLQDNNYLINELNDAQEKMNNILIQKDNIIDDLNNQLIEVKEDDLKINMLNKDIRYQLIEKENSIKKLEMSNKRIQDILIKNKNTFKKLKEINQSYESSNSWKITAPLRKIKKSLK